MATRKPLVTASGTTQQIPDADTLAVGAGIDRATAGALAVGAATATSVVVTPNVGIGGAPTAKLDVTTGQVAIPDGTAAAPSLAFRDDLNTGLFSPANDVVGVGVNGTEIARLQQFGAASTAVFLLGTTAPIGAISGSGNISVDSVSPDATSGVVMLAHGNVGTVIQESYRGGQFAGVRTSGTKISPSAVVAGEGLWNGIGAGYTTAGGYNYGALVTFKAEETYTATASGGRIEFHTTTNGTDGFTTLGSTTTERMRITNAGRVGIGTPTPAERLEVSGSDARINGITVGRGNASAAATSTAVGVSALAVATGANNTAVGASAGDTITSGTNLTCLGYDAEPSAGTATNQVTLGNASVTSLRCAVTTITAISDARDKADVQDLSLGIDFLNTVHPVQFKWDRRDWYDDGVSDGSKKQDVFEPGFIAQELDAAQTAASAEWMALTLKDNPDRWEATPMRLFPVVVKACQELAAKAAAAEARAEAAEARLAALEAAVGNS
jgi:hypothetical protein